MATNSDKIDDAVLALLHLTLHDQSHASTSFAPEVLVRLHEKGMIDGPPEIPESVSLTPDGLQRSKALFAAMFAAPSTEVRASDAQTKYPNIRVELADLGSEMWPILRRVSYAMSDADIDDAEIEQYKSEVRASDDPVGVSRRWVTIAR